MSVDKIFEALSSAPRRRSSSPSFKDRHDSGRDRAAVLRNDVTAGYLKALVVAGECGSRMAREERPGRALWVRRRRTQYACAFSWPRCARDRVPSGKTAPRPPSARESARSKYSWVSVWGHSVMTVLRAQSRSRLTTQFRRKPNRAVSMPNQGHADLEIDRPSIARGD